MTNPYIEAKKAEFRAGLRARVADWGSDAETYAEEFIDTLLDEIESRVVPQKDEYTKEELNSTPHKNSDLDWAMCKKTGFNTCREEVLEAFQHLRTGVEETGV